MMLKYAIFYIVSNMNYLYNSINYNRSDYNLNVHNRKELYNGC